MDLEKSVFLDRQQVRSFDSWAIGQLGVSGVVLMENAGRSAAELIMEKWPLKATKISILCGLGNNGGDGFVIARHLINKGYEPEIIILGDSSRVKGDAKANLEPLKKITEKICDIPTLQGDFTQKTLDMLENTEVIVDSIFGTGLSGKLRPGYAELFERINELYSKVFAIDIPSGLDCDSGKPLGEAIKADYTVTFVAAKKGYFESASREYTGDVFIASIGVDVRFRQD